MTVLRVNHNRDIPRWKIIRYNDQAELEAKTLHIISKCLTPPPDYIGLDLHQINDSKRFIKPWNKVDRIKTYPEVHIAMIREQLIWTGLVLVVQSVQIKLALLQIYHAHISSIRQLSTNLLNALHSTGFTWQSELRLLSFSRNIMQVRNQHKVAQLPLAISFFYQLDSLLYFYTYPFKKTTSNVQESILACF